jgi:TrmH family RNA methyltransferase
MGLLPEGQRERFDVVLVSPRNPLNIGAAARAMANFGFKRLTVVAPFEANWREARSAVGAPELLLKARSIASLAEAVADCTLVVGTGTLTYRKPEQPVVSLPLLAPLVSRELDSGGRVALVFGSEKHGLTREDLSYCHVLVEIPTDPEQPSMNLGQAVAVCLYEVAARVDLLESLGLEILAGAKQAAEKGLISGDSPQKHTSVAKATADCIVLIPGMNPRPTARMSFSADCKAGVDSVGLVLGLKPPTPSGSHFSAAREAHADSDSPDVGDEDSACQSEPADPAATSGRLELLAGLIEEVMIAAGYSPRTMQAANRHDLRLLLRRLSLSSHDTRRILGIFRRILWRLKRAPAPKSGPD